MVIPHHALNVCASGVRGVREVTDRMELQEVTISTRAQRTRLGLVSSRVSMYWALRLWKNSVRTWPRCDVWGRVRVRVERKGWVSRE